jgi:hypothetical protein
MTWTRPKTTKELYDRLLNYFDVRELVSRRVYDKYILDWGKDNYYILQFFDKRVLENLLWLRETTEQPITINDWLWGGAYSQRGLRDNLSPIVQSKEDVYLSGHVLANAIDLVMSDWSANKIRKFIKDNYDSVPNKCRLERKKGGRYISWVHMDCFDHPLNPKIYEFDV